MITEILDSESNPEQTQGGGFKDIIKANYTQEELNVLAKLGEQSVFAEELMERVTDEDYQKAVVGSFYGGDTDNRENNSHY